MFTLRVLCGLGHDNQIKPFKHFVFNHNECNKKVINTKPSHPRREITWWPACRKTSSVSSSVLEIWCTHIPVCFWPLDYLKHLRDITNLTWSMAGNIWDRIEVQRTWAPISSIITFCPQGNLWNKLGSYLFCLDLITFRCYNHTIFWDFKMPLLLS